MIPEVTTAQSEESLRTAINTLKFTMYVLSDLRKRVASLERVQREDTIELRRAFEAYPGWSDLLPTAKSLLEQLEEQNGN